MRRRRPTGRPCPARSPSRRPPARRRATSPGFVVLTRGTDVAPDPVLVRRLARRSSPASGRRRSSSAGTYTRHDERRRRRSSAPTATRPAATSCTPGPSAPTASRSPGRPANFGVVVTSGARHAASSTFDGAEDHLAGYTGLPLDLNPYRKTYGASVRARRRRAAGRRLLRRRLRHAERRRRRAVHVPLLGERRDAAHAARHRRRAARSPCARPTPAPASTRRRSSRPLDGQAVKAPLRRRRRSGSPRGRDVTRSCCSVADYQETKNMEDVAPILPNTATLRATVRVR